MPRRVDPATAASWAPRRCWKEQKPGAGHLRASVRHHTKLDNGPLAEHARAEIALGLLQQSARGGVARLVIDEDDLDVVQVGKGPWAAQRSGRSRVGMITAVRGASDAAGDSAGSASDPLRKDDRRGRATAPAGARSRLRKRRPPARHRPKSARPRRPRGSTAASRMRPRRRASTSARDERAWARTPASVAARKAGRRGRCDPHPRGDAVGEARAASRASA